MSSYDSNQYVKNQKKEWTSVAWAWEKWDEWLDTSMSSCNEYLLEKANVSLKDSVLDIGSGTGYPAIPAAQRVGKEGTETGIDLSEEMLNVARKKSSSLNLNNICFQACDATAIPFGSSRFNAITSRFCFMFLPFLEKTLVEAYRVLKPEGILSAAVWSSAEKNPVFAIPLAILGEFIEIPKPAQGQPGLFSLSIPGILAEKMVKAGFSHVVEKLYPVTWKYESNQKFVEGFRDLAAPFKPIFNQLSQEKQEEAETKLAQAVEKFRSGNNICIEGEAIIVSGKK